MYLYIVHRRVLFRSRLASEVCETGNVHGRVGAARNLGVVKISQATAGELETEFVDLAVAESPSVLGNASRVTIGLLRSAGVGVLSEGLILSADFDPGDGARTDVAAESQAVAVTDVVVDSKRVDAGPFEDGEVALLRSESLEGQR